MTFDINIGSLLSNFYCSTTDHGKLIYQLFSYQLSVIECSQKNLFRHLSNVTFFHWTPTKNWLFNASFSWLHNDLCHFLFIDWIIFCVFSNQILSVSRKFYQYFVLDVWIKHIHNYIWSLKIEALVETIVYMYRIL